MCGAANEAVRYEALNKDLAAAVLESQVMGGTQKHQLQNLVGDGLRLVGLNLETQAVTKPFAATGATFFTDGGPNTTLTKETATTGVLVGGKRRRFASTLFYEVQALHQAQAFHQAHAATEAAATEAAATEAAATK